MTKKSGPLKLFHIITSLGTGGAEMMLYRLLKHIDRTQVSNQVICMIQPGMIGERIRALGLPLYSFDMQPGSPSLRAFSQLLRLLRQEHPVIIQTWMYHADLMGGLAGYLTGTPVIWGIRNTSLDPAFVKYGTIRVAKLNARLSNLIPRRITICSNEARNQHIIFGYAPQKFVTIPNGFELDVFYPDPAARFSLRKELNLNQDAFLIGLLARFDPLKDHQNFIQAAGIFLNQHPRTHFLLCGGDITSENEALRIWIDSTGFSPNFHLLGHREDIPRILNGLDINTLSSVGEAFPNVIGEAMACGVPCVATGVGDTGYLVGDTGIIVALKNPQALAGGWEQIFRMSVEERLALGERARRRIQIHFNIAQIAVLYERLYEQIMMGED